MMNRVLRIALLVLLFSPVTDLTMPDLAEMADQRLFTNTQTILPQIGPNNG